MTGFDARFSTVGFIDRARLAWRFELGVLVVGLRDRRGEFLQDAGIELDAAAEIVAGLFHVDEGIFLRGDAIACVTVLIAMLMGRARQAVLRLLLAHGHAQESLLADPRYTARQ